MAVYKYFLMFLLDFPFVLFTLIAGVCVWRIPFLVREFKKVFIYA